METAAHASPVEQTEHVPDSAAITQVLDTIRYILDRALSVTEQARARQNEEREQHTGLFLTDAFPSVVDWEPVLHDLETTWDDLEPILRKLDPSQPASRGARLEMIIRANDLLLDATASIEAAEKSAQNGESRRGTYIRLEVATDRLDELRKLWTGQD